MDRKLTAVSGALAVAVSLSLPAQADNHEQATLNPVELYACTFMEGKGMKDLDKLDAKYKKWADKHNKGHSVWRMAPIFRSTDGDFHVGYIGAWNTGPEMGAGLDAWGGNETLVGEYQEVVECGHSLVASVEINAPNGPPENGVVWFSSCSVQDDATDQQAFEAHKAMMASMRDKGGKGQAWLFYPSLGFGKLEFDYFSVLSFNSLEELGEGWHGYYNKGGWRGAEKMDAVTDCDSPRVYSADAIRIAPQE